MNKQDRIDLLDEAQCKLAEAMECIAAALKGTEYEAHAQAYILGHLESWMDSDRYNMGIQQYMDALEKESEVEN